MSHPADSTPPPQPGPVARHCRFGVVHGSPPQTRSMDRVHQNMDQVHGAPILTIPKITEVDNNRIKIKLNLLKKSEFIVIKSISGYLLVKVKASDINTCKCGLDIRRL